VNIENQISTPKLANNELMLSIIHCSNQHEPSYFEQHNLTPLTFSTTMFTSETKASNETVH
jgi:hypothetical protein